MSSKQKTVLETTYSNLSRSEPNIQKEEGTISKIKECDEQSVNCQNSDMNNKKPRLKRKQTKFVDDYATLKDVKQYSNIRSTKKRKLSDVHSFVTSKEMGNTSLQSEVTKTVAETISKVAKNSGVAENKDILISAGRHLRSQKYVGAHTSIAGGLYKAIEEAEHLGATSIGMFLKSQRTWKSKELDANSIKLFKEKLESSEILPQMIIPHGSYLLNCGSANEEILKKSRDCLIDELKRCELLGIPMYNFHPGSAKDSTPDKCIELISETINIAHSQTKSVITLIENMSNQGNTVGGDFHQLKSIISKVKDKSRIGVCFDTCHAFAAGYDLRTEEGYEHTKKEFDNIIGRKYLKAVHLNDSKGDLGCHLDRHENIGKGKLGLNFFSRIMNDPFFNDIALVLETPECDYKQEIDLLYSLCHT